MIISDLTVDYVSFDDDDKEISAIAISYKDKNGREQRRWLGRVRSGQWSFKRKGAWLRLVCSSCGKHAYEVNEKRNLLKYTYCPYCGALMSEEILDEEKTKA